MILNFLNEQCVEICNKDEFDFVYDTLRSARAMSLENYIADVGYPEFPIYLENSPKGVGFTYQPFNTWTKQPLEILTIKNFIEQ